MTASLHRSEPSRASPAGDARSAAFVAHRRRLYGIAYRMLGTRAEAEDVLQDAYLRWHEADAERVHTPEAWLVATVTRLAIDRLRAQKREREAYVGPWLPEPLIEDGAPGPEAHVELASDLSVAFLVLLERLAPEERAALLLHDVFDCDYADIARILGRQEAACRQVVHRARTRLREARPRFRVSDIARRRLLDRFAAALRAPTHDALLALFADDATWTSDGGGKAKAARKVVRGGERVARFAHGVWHRHIDAVEARPVQLNGEAGLLMCVHGTPMASIAVDTDGVRILAVYTVLNPDKLAVATTR